MVEAAKHAPSTVSMPYAFSQDMEVKLPHIFASLLNVTYLPITVVIESIIVLTQEQVEVTVFNSPDNLSSDSLIE